MSPPDSDGPAAHGFLRVAAASPPLALADPASNAERIVALVQRAQSEGAAVLLLPELAVCGYSCEDLFLTESLLDASSAAVGTIATATAGTRLAVIVGAPLALPDGRLFNTALVLARGRIVGAVPKQQLPNHGEFYERRWFASGAGVRETLADGQGGHYLLTAPQLFDVGGVRLAIEVCEDLWSPLPPGADHAVAGAELILNPSASNELIAKSDYRRALVRMASAQRLCGYVYAGAGPGESSKDLVFGGHLLAYENGHRLAESDRFRLDGAMLVADVDIVRLRRDRRANPVFTSAPRPSPYPVVDTRLADAGAAAALPLRRPLDPHPFVPDDAGTLDARAHEILQIQATGLARRLQSLPEGRPGADGVPCRLVLGLSGGLDSTLALLVGCEALTRLGLPVSALLAVTLPGPATSSQTLATARQLAAAAGVPLREIPIGAAVGQHLLDLQHPEGLHDVTFENAQARERTQLLFDLANQQGAIVLGTGDLSELALGWCTFNADHMSGYNVNAGVPKTLVAYVIRWFAAHRAPDDLAEALQRVLETPISPELVPGADPDTIGQRTEDLIGPYELHDFFLYCLLRHGDSARRIRFLAEQAFAGRHAPEVVKRWLTVFLRRFFSQQFKRTTLPPGPKVGTVALSPRGDWRMPDEASAAAWLAEIETPDPVTAPDPAIDDEETTG